MRVTWLALLAVLALAAAAGALAARQLLPASSVHGTEFHLLTQVDQSFCAASDNGTSEGREVRLETCGVSSFQRFTLTDNADDTNLIVDSQGMCLDGRFRQHDFGLPVTVSKCHFSNRFRWSYLPDGTIQSVLNGKCLRVQGAASNAAVYLDTCNASDPRFQWLVTH